MSLRARACKTKNSCPTKVIVLIKTYGFSKNILICTIVVSNLLLLSHLRLETSVTDEQLRKQVVTEEVVQAELEAQRRVLDVEHQRKMAAIREEMENEVIRLNFKGYYLTIVCNLSSLASLDLRVMKYT